MYNLLPVRESRMKTLFKIIIIVSLLTSVGYMLWNIWPTIMLHSIKWQRIINEELSNLLYEAKENHLTAAVYLFGLSFLYGVLHSVGPGHGKMIVTTFLATHPTKVKHGLILTILSAFLQAVVAVSLVSILMFLFNHSMREINSSAADLVSLSCLMMTGLGIIIVFRALKVLWPHFHSKHHHQCNHCASADDLNNASTWQAYLGIIASIGIRPCTGAIMVLLFANMIGIYWLGITSAFVMAIGTAITTSTIALLTISGKKLINRYLNRKEDKLSISNLSLQFMGGIFLILVGLVLFNTSSYGISPVF